MLLVFFFVVVVVVVFTGPQFRVQQASHHSFLMHFREVKLPIHIKMERATGEGPEEQNESKITRALINLQDEYRTRAAHNIACGQERQKQQYDKKHNTNTTLKIGNKVLKENCEPAREPSC